MGFCTKCGKPLQDGEICSCQQQAAPQMTAPQPQMTAPQMTAPQPQQAAPQMTAPQPQQPAGPNVVTELVDLVKGLFTSPAETIAAYTAKANIAMVAILIGAQALVSMFVRLFRMLIANAQAASKAKKSLDDLDSLLSYASSYYSGKTKVYETGEIFANMFKEILVVAVSAAIFALVVWLLIKAFDKVNVTYIQALSVYSLVSVLAIPATVLSWVIGLTSVGFLDEIAACVSVFANVVGYAFIFLGIRSLGKNEKSTPLVMGIAFVCISFISWIIGLMF
ncbi:MAG: hypothetical protein ACI4EJ_08235 [Bacteroides sp.]